MNVDGKQRENISLVAYAGPEQIVYEGSEVKLDGYCTFEELPEKRKHLEYNWSLDKAKPHISDIQIEFSNTRTPSFVAPFVKFNPVTSVEKNDKVKNFPFIQLRFKLVVRDKNSDPALESIPSFVTVIVKMIQRVLIFQGGGALGAYELGAFKALCKKIMEKDNQNPSARANRPLFDIIAGTSIGAINAALIVHSVTEDIEKHRGTQEQKVLMEREDQCIIEDKYVINDTHRAWNYSINQLEKFWTDISHSLLFFSKDNPVFWNWWKLWNEFSSSWINLYKDLYPTSLKEIDLTNNYLNPFYLFFHPSAVTPIADPEAARRYFSWLLFPYVSASKIITPNFLQRDTKFLTGIGIPQFTRFDNKPLVEFVEKHYWNSRQKPLKTYYDKGEPRLLIVGVDILDATTAVTFDSYLCESRYPRGKTTGLNEKNEDNSQSITQPEHLIKYPNGITMEHVRASISPYTVIDYPQLKDEQNNEIRYFWDGAFLSNTPLREVLHLHRYYWLGNQEIEHVPHLEVYIINLYPTVEKNQKEPPTDADTIQDREIDIRFHDRTQFDKKIAETVTDYLILHGQLKNLAEKYIFSLSKDKSHIEKFNEDYQKMLERSTHSEKRSQKGKKDSESRVYRDLIEGRFDLANVIYIQREDDEYTIFGKAAEFSKETIDDLKQQGCIDASKAFDKYCR